MKLVVHADSIKNSFVVQFFSSGELLYEHASSAHFTMGWVGVGCNLTDIFSGQVFELSPVVLFFQIRDTKVTTATHPILQ